MRFRTIEEVLEGDPKMARTVLSSFLAHWSPNDDQRESQQVHWIARALYLWAPWRERGRLSSFMDEPLLSPVEKALHGMSPRPLAEFEVGQMALIHHANQTVHRCGGPSEIRGAGGGPEGGSER